MKVSRRSETPEDEPFLRRLIIETVTQELSAWAWPLPMRDHLLGIQYQSRRAGVKTQFPDGSSQIILANGEDAGWLFIADLADHIRIIEIMVSPGYRGKGLGTAILREILAAADNVRKPVRLSVNAMNNGAVRLYQRLGFRHVSSDEVQHQMEWTPLLSSFG